MSRKAQEEMVGFVLIIVLVAVILLAFLGFSLRNPQKEIVESYEVESFIQAFLQYTSECRDNLEYLSLQKLIFACNNGKKCLNKKDTCEVLNSTLKNILGESWRVEGNRPLKGYELRIISEGKEMLLISKGNSTENSRGAMQDFSRSGNLIEIFFNVYY